MSVFYHHWEYTPGLARVTAEIPSRNDICGTGPFTWATPAQEVSSLPVPEDQTQVSTQTSITRP